MRSSGITARSWNSRTEKPAWPPGVASRFRSCSVASAIAVEDIAIPMPAMSATASDCASAIAATAAAVTSTWTEPMPRIGRRSVQPARVELEADEKQHHHAELGEVQHRLRIADERESPGPDRHAGGEIAEHRAEPSRLKSGTAITPARGR